jgi:glycosyltransferase involved in cell wall biosynthesis
VQLKVAFVFVAMPVGGAEDLVVALAPHLAKQCVEPQFVCLRELGVLGEELRERGQPVAVIPAARSKRWSPLGNWRFAAWLRENRIDIVHSHTYHAHTYSVPAARLAGVLSVMQQHKTVERQALHRWLTTWILVRKTSGLIALSEKIRDDLARSFGLPPDRIAVVPNGIDRTEFSPAKDKIAVRQRLGFPSDVFLVGSVASLRKVKNHEATIDVASGLTASHPELRVVLVGDGPDRAELEGRVNALGLGAKIRFAGNQRPVSNWIQALDLFVLPSHWEGQSLAVLQAVSCDVPILASRIEGNTHVLGEDHPGLFNQNSREEYIALVRRTIQNAHFRDALRVAQSRHLPPDAVEAAAKLEEFYRSLAARTVRRRA